MRKSRDHFGDATEDSSTCCDWFECRKWNIIRIIERSEGLLNWKWGSSAHKVGYLALSELRVDPTPHPVDPSKCANKRILTSFSPTTPHRHSSNVGNKRKNQNLRAKYKSIQPATLGCTLFCNLFKFQFDLSLKIIICGCTQGCWYCCCALIADAAVEHTNSDSWGSSEGGRRRCSWWWCANVLNKKRLHLLGIIINERLNVDLNVQRLLTKYQESSLRNSGSSQSLLLLSRVCAWSKRKLSGNEFPWSILNTVSISLSSGVP